MMTTRRGVLDALRARVALGALIVTATTGSTEATADGELTPMIGAAVVGVRAPEHDAELVGFQLEAAWWWGRFGLAAEGSMRWGTQKDVARSAALGGSARLRLFECLLPSLLDPRDIVELGIEVHSIVEHVWQDGTDTAGYGLGLAARLRGGGDDGFSSLLAESRLFVRVVSFRHASIDAVGRILMPIDRQQTQELTVVFGIGASFGSGESGYVQRFHAQPFDSWRSVRPNP